MTVIVSKYGYGKPANGELAKAEIGIDLQNGAIYTSTDGSDIIALGITEVEWGDIIGVPPELIVGGDNYVDLSELEAAVAANAGDIATLQETVGQVQSDLAQALEDIAANTTAIGVNAGNISSLSSQINDEPNGLVHLIAANTEAHEANASEISKLWAALDGAQSGLVLGGKYDADQNQVTEVTADGTAAGLVVGQNLPIGEETKGVYVVVTVGGELEGIEAAQPTSDSHKANGQTAFPGDWLLSDGQHGWILMDFHTDATEWGTIGGTLSNQTDLMDEFDLYIKKTDTIDGGTYTAV